MTLHLLMARCEGASMSSAIAEHLREALQLAWAVRVLDAYDEKTGRQTRWETFSSCTGRGEICPNNGIRYSGNQESARLSAAAAVWPELSKPVQARIGARP